MFTDTCLLQGRASWVGRGPSDCAQRVLFKHTAPNTPTVLSPHTTHTHAHTHSRTHTCDSVHLRFTLPHPASQTCPPAERARPEAEIRCPPPIRGGPSDWAQSGSYPPGARKWRRPNVKQLCKTNLGCSGLVLSSAGEHISTAALHMGPKEGRGRAGREGDGAGWRGRHRGPSYGPWMSEGGI